MLDNNICYKFGIPHSDDLQRLQNVCLDVTSASSHLQNLLIFIAFNLLIFFTLVFCAKLISNNKEYIRAYYKSTFSYFVHTTTIIGLMPIVIYFLYGEFTIISKLIMTLSLLVLIYIKYEYWPLIKKHPPAHSGIYASAVIALFTLSYFTMLQHDFKSDDFSTTALLSILFIYCMVLHIFLRLIREIKLVQKQANG